MLECSAFKMHKFLYRPSASTFGLLIFIENGSEGAGVHSKISSRVTVGGAEADFPSGYSSFNGWLLGRNSSRLSFRVSDARIDI